MKVQLVIADNNVDPETRIGYAPSALKTLKDDLDRTTWGVSYSWIGAKVGGTILHTARIRDNNLIVAAFVSPAFMSTSGLTVKEAIERNLWAVAIKARVIEAEEPRMIGVVPGKPPKRTQIVTAARLQAITLILHSEAPKRPPVTEWEG